MITVDPREPFDILSIGDKIERLQYGDFKIEAGGRTLLIERKTLADFWSSLKSGRLNEQLSGCDALIIHRTAHDWHYFDDNGDNIMDALNGVSKHHIVWWADNIEHLEKTLRRYEGQLEDGSFGEFRKVIVKDDIATPVRILAQFEGIGRDRAEKLWRAFGTLQDLFFVLIDEDTSAVWPEGIGQVTIQNMKNNLREKYKK